MSGWLLAVREVHAAGGRMPLNRMCSDLFGVTEARRLGLIEPAGVRGTPSRHAPVVLTQRGRDLAEGRLRKVDARYGRGWEVTWLAALPRTNEVRLTSAVHRAQDDGTCYW